MASKHERHQNGNNGQERGKNRLRIETIKWINRIDAQFDLGRDSVESPQNHMVWPVLIADKNIQINNNIRFKFAGNWHKLCASPFFD